MRYGHFDDERREYVITRPDTPLPWINYLGSEDYVALLSNTAGGYSFVRDARLRRLLRYRYNDAPLDVGGRFLYVRDDVSGDYWNPGWQPTQRDLDGYSCRHGLGYSVISGERGGIRAETIYLVPPGRTLEVWRVTITNERSETARVSLFGAVEFCLWDAQDDATNFQRNLSIGEVLVEDEVIYHLTEYRERRDHFAWFASSRPVTGFDTSRERFLGPYRGWDRPVAVERGVLSESVAHGWQPVGALQVALELRPGHSEDVTFVLGYTENPPARKFDPPGSGHPDTARAREVLEPYREDGQVDRDLAHLRETWEARLRTFQVTTGDVHVDRMVNTWNQYQCMVTFNLSRSASMFESGIGRGMGFRDSNQDLLGFVHLVPERARERILDIAATQLPDGGAYHQYQPLTKRGNNDIGAGFNDDPLWLVLAVAAYTKETGDLAILDEPVPWDNADGSETPLARPPAPLHLVHPGPPGPARPAAHRPSGLERLPEPQRLLGASRGVIPDRPQSPRRAWPSRCSSRRSSCSPHARRRHWRACATTTLKPLAARQPIGSMTAAIEAHAWDGAWYRRAYDHVGRPVGSAVNDEGRIFIEPQGLMAMAGVGLEDGRTRTALASVREHLATAARHRARGAGLHELPPRARRDLLVPARLQGERGGLLPHEPLDHDRRGHHRERRGGARLLPAHQPLGPRGDLRRAPLRAVRLRPDDRRPGRADARRGQELVADRDGGLEHGRHQPVDPGHPPRARRAPDRARDPDFLGGLPCDASVPRHDLRDRGPARQPRGGRLGCLRQPADATAAAPVTAAAPATVELVVDGRPIEGTVIPLPPPGTPLVRVDVRLP